MQRKNHFVRRSFDHCESANEPSAQFKYRLQQNPLGSYTFSPRIVLEGIRWIDATDRTYAVDVFDEALDPDDDLNRYEDRITSQNGEDGIIRELLLRIGSPTRFVIEIAAGDGTENVSAQLIERYNFSGCLVEGDADLASSLARRHASRQGVSVIEAFVDVESVVAIVSATGAPPEPDVISIDIDGNDYHIWHALARSFRPRIVVIEYNASYGPVKHWVMPYDATHRWQGDNYFGASIASLSELATDLGYTLIGTESNGVNAFFVRDDLMDRARFPAKPPEDAYHPLRLSAPDPSINSSNIRDSYTRGYYVNDCGGHAEFGYDDPLSIADAPPPSYRDFLRNSAWSNALWT